MRTNNIVIFLVISCSVLSQLPPKNSHAEDPSWELIADLTKQTFFYAPSTIECCSNNVAKVWTKNIYKDAYSNSKKTRNKHKIAYTITKFSLECTNKKYGVEAFANYNRNGMPEGTETMSYIDYRYVIPGSTGNDLLDVVCNSCSDKN